MKIQEKFFWGRGGPGGCERRIEVFVKIEKKKKKIWGGGGGGGPERGGVRGGEVRLWGGGEGSGWM